MKKLRIGFLSAAGIGRKNWKAIFHSGNCVVSAVASRDANKSRKYIDDCQREFAFAETPRAFGSYEPAFEVNEKIITVASDVKCPPGVDRWCKATQRRRTRGCGAILRIRFSPANRTTIGRCGRENTNNFGSLPQGWTQRHNR